MESNNEYLYSPSPAEMNELNNMPDNEMYNSNESNNLGMAEDNMNNNSNMEEFTNLSSLGINVDLILKSIFFGAIFYLLSLPEVYKMTSGVVGKKVDGVLLHALVYAVLYYILVHFI